MLGQDLLADLNVLLLSLLLRGARIHNLLPLVVLGLALHTRAKSALPFFQSVTSGGVMQ